MKKIEELIDLHTEIFRKEEPIILSKLRMLNELYPECEASEDAMLFDEIIHTFADVVRYQKEIIDDLRMQMEAPPRPCGFSGVGLPTNEAQVQDAFLQFCFCQPKPLSSYTANDYCSRIRMLWRTFCQEREACSPETPLLNAFSRTEQLDRFLNENKERIKQAAIVQAALNKFTEFTVWIKENDV